MRKANGTKILIYYRLAVLLFATAAYKSTFRNHMIKSLPPKQLPSPSAVNLYNMPKTSIRVRFNLYAN